MRLLSVFVILILSACGYSGQSDLAMQGPLVDGSWDNSNEDSAFFFLPNEPEVLVFDCVNTESLLRFTSSGHSKKSPQDIAFKSEVKMSLLIKTANGQLEKEMIGGNMALPSVLLSMSEPALLPLYEGAGRFALKVDSHEFQLPITSILSDVISTCSQQSKRP